MIHVYAEDIMSLIDQGKKTLSENCHRLVVLGSTMVGKSAIVSRFLNDTFDNRYTPTVEDFHRKIYRIRRQIYIFDILDCSGHNPFPTIRKLTYMTGDMFLLVYNICNSDTFKEAKLILEQLNECFISTTSNDRFSPIIYPPLILVGNQIDRETCRVISSTECLTILAGRPCCAFIEVSAMYGINIDELFDKLFELANLPMEMSPAYHRKVTPSYVGTSNKSGICGFLTRKISSACGVVQPNVRRPSVHSDMQMAFRRENKKQRHMECRKKTNVDKCCLQ